MTNMFNAGNRFAQAPVSNRVPRYTPQAPMLRPNPQPLPMQRPMPGIGMPAGNIPIQPPVQQPIQPPIQQTMPIQRPMPAPQMPQNIPPELMQQAGMGGIGRMPIDDLQRQQLAQAQAQMQARRSMFGV